MDLLSERATLMASTCARRTNHATPDVPKVPLSPTRRDAVVDDYHGTPVADPYRWLEDPQAPETHAWLEAQRQLTSALLAAMPSRDLITARLTTLWNYPRYSVPHTRRNQVLFLEKCWAATPGRAL